MKKYTLLLVIFLFALSFCACSGGQTTSPTQVPVDPTATQTTMEEPETSEKEMPPTAIQESEVSTQTPTPTVEPTLEPTPEPTLEPTPEPTLEPTPEPTQDTSAGDVSQAGGSTDPASKPNCQEKAAFYADVTVPDDTTYRQGETFTKIWKVRNEGTCTWGSAYALVFAGGAQMNGVSGSPLPEAAPGDIIEIPLELTAPLRGGTHVGNWMFSDPQGNWFGVGATVKGELWVRIVVNYIAPEGSDAATSTETGGTEPAQCGSERNTVYENEVLTFINNARNSNGLTALTLNEKLTAAALVHSNDMACKDFVDHTGSDGSLWFDRISNEGYVYTTAKENIYVGNPAFGGTPAGAFDWWMNSQIHRENILSDDITEIGIAYVFNANSGYGGYYTTVFARP